MVDRRVVTVNRGCRHGPARRSPVGQSFYDNLSGLKVVIDVDTSNQRSRPRNAEFNGSSVRVAAMPDGNNVDQQLCVIDCV
jgi:hypothetical protein